MADTAAVTVVSAFTAVGVTGNEHMDGQTTKLDVLRKIKKNVTFFI